jgi:hypothetical protein
MSCEEFLYTLKLCFLSTCGENERNLNMCSLYDEFRREQKNYLKLRNIDFDKNLGTLSPLQL